MKKILLLGAGLSATTMIKYLLAEAAKNNWMLRIGDICADTVERKINKHPNGEAFCFNVSDETLLNIEVEKADVVISFLPARFHPLVAAAAVIHSKHMVTASYVSKEMQSLDEEAKEKNICLWNELGVDPGIDHMSAMKIVDEIKAKGGKVISFKSNTGGLIAPECDTNPWNYKFTWNPRNVVLAGQGAAKFIRNGKYKYIPYHRLFERLEESEVLDYGRFEIYPNRDSLSYRKTYGFDDIPTILRGTFRRLGYCKAWNVFVQLGMTDDTYELSNVDKMTYRKFINAFLPFHPNKTVEEKLIEYLPFAKDEDIQLKLNWLGIFEDKAIGLESGTPAQILQHLLEKKWALDKDDIDMIVMQHKIVYELDNKQYEVTSSMVVKGKDTNDTAMSITVGMPVAIATKLLLQEKLFLAGVQVPNTKCMYEPILEELEKVGIAFIEETKEIH
jgi:saccharopine dehydrogenase-like NADP-dependent oxidoreductase